MRRGKKKTEMEEMSFWQSYSDMMAALLLVFVLIIATAKFSYEKVLVDNLEKEESLKQQEMMLDRIVGVRKDIIGDLKDSFEGTGMEISVDPDTGAITFDSNILFDYNKYELKESGKEFLKEFIPRYFDVILSSEFSGYIAEIIIEGHTDDNGEYLYNLELSQKRALSVVTYCLSPESNIFNEEEIKAVQEIITANGRASNDLIYADEAQTIVDKDASRRVEIKFRLTEEEMIQEIKKVLEGS